MLYNLVEKTSGPWHGRIWRCEEMTAEQAEAINSKITVMKWEQAEPFEHAAIVSKQKRQQTNAKK